MIRPCGTLGIEGSAPLRQSFLPYLQPRIDADDEQALPDTLRSGWLTTGFQQELAAIEDHSGVAKGQYRGRGGGPTLMIQYQAPNALTLTDFREKGPCLELATRRAL